jgi:hypothetical protein
VADNLRRRGHTALTPELAYPTAAPFWSRHVDSVAQVLTDLPEVEPLVLVGHSGAGALLPAIARAVAKPVAAYIFVDAGLPIGGANRMDTSGFADYLRDLHARGERFPNWREDELHSVVPDPAQRARLLAELRPQPLAFWEEPLPVVEGWPDAPAAYLQFTPTYDAAAEQAGLLGWPFLHLQGGHFHMLVDPAAVADALLELTRSMRVLPDA